MSEPTPSFQQTIRAYRGLFAAIVRFFRRISPAQYLALAVAAAIAYYVVVFSVYSIQLQEVFYTQAFDSGIDDQGIWLLSRFLDPFVTVRGLNIFADSVTYYHVFLAPLFWLWDNINLLYIIQSLFLGLTAWPLWLFARDRLKSDWLAAAVAGSFLLYPALQNMNLDQYHSEAIAVFFVAFTLYHLFKENYRWYYAFLGLSLIAKDEVAFTGIFIGFFLVLFKKEYRQGLITIALCAAWYLLVSRVMMPLFNGIGILAPQPLTYSHWYRGLMENLFNPLFYWQNFLHPESLRYYFDLLAPAGFLPLLSPPLLLILFPSVAINVLSGCGYIRSIAYHYNYVQAAVVFFGLIEALYLLQRKKAGGRNGQLYLGGAVLLVALVANATLSHFPLFHQWGRIGDKFAQLGSRDVRSRQAALRLVPPEAKVSASYSFVPHLSHRREIYMFPNPFRQDLWNQWFQEGKGLPPYAGHVDYLMIALNDHGPAERLIIDYLAAAKLFTPVYRDRSFLVLKAAALTRPDPLLDRYLARPNDPSAAAPVRAVIERERRRLAGLVSHQPNLVRNGDFEQVVGEIPKEWRVECWQDPNANCTYFADPQNGRHGRFAAALLHDGTADSRWIQEVAVRPNTTYLLSGWIKTAGVGAKGGGATLGLMGASYRSRALRGTNGWQFVELEFETEVDQKKVTLACRLGDYGATNSGRAYFDQIELKEVPDGAR